MKFKLEVDCDNAAFGDNPLAIAQELDTIWIKVFVRIKKDDYVHSKWNTLLDTNGNSVGRFKLAEDIYWREDGE